MKYKLKKDLPFAKAGTEIWVDNTLSGWIDAKIYEPQCGRKEYRVDKIMLGTITNLLIEGWIEEVKPREWEVNEWMGDIYNKGSIIMTTADQIQPKRIKVREVIE